MCVYNYKCMCNRIFMHRGQTPSFEVLISCSEDLGIAFPLCLISVRALTLSHRQETFGLGLSRTALSKTEMHTFFKCLDVAVDSSPRYSMALFGGKTCPRVKTISCGGTDRVCAPQASKNFVLFTVHRFFKVFKC